MKIQDATMEDWTKAVGNRTGSTPSALGLVVKALTPGQVIRIACQCTAQTTCPTRNTMVSMATRTFGKGIIHAAHEGPGVLLIMRAPEAEHEQG